MSSSTLTAPQRGRKAPGGADNFAVSFDKFMEAGLALVGTPVLTVSPVTVPPFIASSPAVTAAAKTILGKSVPAGRAITFVGAGGLADNTYRVELSCANDATPAETKVAYILVDVAEN